MIQTKLFKTIDEIKLADYQKCGRTDKGVSAAGNVFAVTILIKEKDQKCLVKRLNSRLPDDIIIFSCVEVPLNFNARNDCVSRTYRYYFFEEGLNLKLMRKACKYFEGKHDFKNFCKMKPSYEINGTVREIFSCKIHQNRLKNDESIPNNSHFENTPDFQFEEFIDDTPLFENLMPLSFVEIKGTGFLWHMVL